SWLKLLAQPFRCAVRLLRLALVPGSWSPSFARPLRLPCLLLSARLGLLRLSGPGFRSRCGFLCLRRFGLGRGLGLSRLRGLYIRSGRGCLGLRSLAFRSRRSLLLFPGFPVNAQLALACHSLDL